MRGKERVPCPALPPKHVVIERAKIFVRFARQAPSFLRRHIDVKLRYRSRDFTMLSPSPFPLPSREGSSKTLSPGGRGPGEGA